MTVDTGIQITPLRNEPGAASLKVEVDVARVRQAEAKATSQYAKRAKLPGFRPGKVPLAVIRKQFRDAIRETVLRELIGDSWKAAVDQESLKPIADPRVRDVKFEEGAPITFELLVEVKPELKLTRLGGFPLTRRVTPVSDEMVDRQIEELRRQKAPWVPVEGRKAEPGEMVAVSIAAREGAAGDRAEAKQYQIVLGQGQAIPDVEERVMGLVPGETIDTTVRYPDDVDDETKRGQTREVRITLHEIKQQALPPLDDGFARELGDFDSLADLRAKVREDMEREAAHEADAEVRRQLIDQIIEANAVQAPPQMVQRVLRAFAQAYDVPDDQLERFAQEFGPVAERQVKRDLVIDHVAEREQLTATEDDLDRRVEEIAQRRGAAPGQVYTSLQKAGRLRELERNLTEEKVFSHLLAQSSVTNA